MTRRICLWPQARHEPAALAQQATEAITRLSKGFGQQLCTRQRQEVGELLLGTLETALRAPQVILRSLIPQAQSLFRRVFGWRVAG